VGGVNEKLESKLHTFYSHLFFRPLKNLSPLVHLQYTQNIHHTTLAVQVRIYLVLTKVNAITYFVLFLSTYC